MKYTSLRIDVIYTKQLYVMDVYKSSQDKVTLKLGHGS